MGILIATVIILIWILHLIYILLFAEISISSPLMYLHILLQTYFYTGLFITAHDAMHGTVAKSRKINVIFGTIATTLFAFLSYPNLAKKHYQHHLHPTADDDPDFSPHNNNFFVWWFVFMKNYVTWYQLVFMAIVFNFLLFWSSEIRLIVFWILPAILSTFQLFYFGTYLPHRRPFTDNMQPHFSRSFPKLHFAAMLTCYFFGYHWEHHNSPTTPWWKLYRLKK